MIEKMKFVTITGPKADIDRAAATYLSKYEIHLENAMTELTDESHLTPFLEVNPYREELNLVNSYYVELDEPEKVTPAELKPSDAAAAIYRVRTALKNLEDEKKELEEQLSELEKPLGKIRPFRNLEFDVSDLSKFEYIQCRFGRIPREHFQKFEAYIFNNPDTLFLKSSEDEGYVYGAYFVPRHQATKINAIYYSMHFEPLRIPDEYEGTVKDACELLEAQKSEIDRKLSDNHKARKALFQMNASQIVSARASLTSHAEYFDIRKMAACTKGKDNDLYYIICGWMSETDADALIQDTENDDQFYCIANDDRPDDDKEPPVKLKNPKILKPFEMYTNMYGLPAYDEMDPTWFIALTYSFIFGAMFGDVGQGLLLFIGGALLYKFKKMDLAGIISCAGVFSTFFGFMFGSIFGFEDVIEARWLRPTEAMTNVPFIGQLNTVFIVAICFGMFLILTCMVFNVLNAVKIKDTEKIWFDTNAVAGLVFYGSLTAAVLLFLTGAKLPAGIVMAVMFGAPLIVMFLKEPLTHLVEKKSAKIEGGAGMFLVQGFFEMFEVLLSYFSNTLSFVRIGAFAVSHAAMMGVVLQLAGYEEGGGSFSWVVIILGNLFVCGMEGLIVGIQVLRLEYYEFFSRFYKGSGREFEPFHK
ncbi:MAG: ATPase [Clostridiales bacterium]|nr:ATPase [Candidatus Blautia equi]